MPRPDPGDPPADETLHQLLVRESEWRKIPLAALARASLLAASEDRFAITGDGALAPNWREQLKDFAAAIELQRDGGWGQAEPWSQLKLFRTKSAEYLAWLNDHLARLNDSGELARWLDHRPEPDRERRQAQRRRSIDRFIEDQGRRHHWIRVLDLLDWCAQSTTTAGTAEQTRAWDLAANVFVASIPRAEFEREGRPKILYLSSRVTGVGSIPCRLSREAFERQRVAAELPLEMLAHCWLPRGLARQWIKSHGYRWPPYLDPEKPPTVLEAGEKLDGRPQEGGGRSAHHAPPSPQRSGRRGPVPGALDRYGEADRALFPELERIIREENLSLTAAARRLAEADKVSGIGNPKSRAQRLAARYRREREN